MADSSAASQPAALALRWGALAVLTPFPLFVGGYLPEFLLSESQVLAALAVGTGLGILGLAVVWTAAPGSLGSVLGRRFRIVPVGLWVVWAMALGLFNFLGASRAVSSLTPELATFPGVLPSVVAVVAALIVALIWWQRRTPSVVRPLGVVTGAAWVALFLYLPFSAAIPMVASELPGSNPFPAAAAHIYLVRMVNVAGLAAATVLLAAPLAPGHGNRKEVAPGRLGGRAAAVGITVLGLMYVGMHGGGLNELLGILPGVLRPVAVVAALGGVALWGYTVVATSPVYTGRRHAPAWMWVPLAVALAGLAAWLAPAYGTALAANAEGLVLALGYILAPWLGVLLGQRLVTGGLLNSHVIPPRPGWAAVAWAGGLATSLPGITGFGLFGGGPVVDTLLPHWRFMRYLHPQADWALAAGFAGAVVIYAVAHLIVPRLPHA